MCALTKKLQTLYIFQIKSYLLDLFFRPSTKNNQLKGNWLILATVYYLELDV